MNSCWESFCLIFNVNHHEFIKPIYNYRRIDAITTPTAIITTLHYFEFFKTNELYNQNMTIILNKNLTGNYVYFIQTDQNKNHVLSFEKKFTNLDNKTLNFILDILEKFFKLECNHLLK